MVTTVPMKKPTMSISQSFRDLVISAPMPSPMGIMAISVPREKKPIPTIRRQAPVRNIIMVPAGRGVMVTLSRITINVIGSTDVRDSIIFSFNVWFIGPPLFQMFPYYHFSKKKRSILAFFGFFTKISYFCECQFPYEKSGVFCKNTPLRTGQILRSPKAKWGVVQCSQNGQYARFWTKSP